MNSRVGTSPPLRLAMGAAVHEWDAVVSNHGDVHLGGRRLVDGSVSPDAASILEIGNAGAAAAG
jgi:hypothetical protein